MSKRIFHSAVILAATVALAGLAFAQTYGTKGYAPGAWKPDELPKALSNAKPFDAHDLSGVWSMPTKGFEKHSLTSGPLDLQHVPTEMKQNSFPPPMTAWGKARFDATRVSYGPRSVPPGTGNDPVSTCDPLGYPRAIWEANLRPFEFVMARDRVLQHMQYHDVWRTIWTDGRALPKDPDPAWYGYSVGRWEGDTFVVDSTGYDERTWIDHFGNPHSEQMHLEERFHRTDPDTLVVNMVLTDPKAYTKPWVSDTITFVNPKAAIFEEICAPSEENLFNDRIRDAAVGKSKP